jgi:hypothetical protein
MAAEPFIVDLVAKLTALLREARTLPPVYGYLPDDVAHLPVLVVGRPDLTDSGTPAVMTQRVDVVLLGRRIADEDAQAELNGLGDECFDTLGGTRGVKVGIDALRCVEVRAGSVSVAGQDMPAYSFTVARDVITC